MSRWSTESDRFALFQHKTDTTITAALQPALLAWPSWPATTALTDWSTDQTIHVLLALNKTNICRDKERRGAGFFYLFTGPALSNIIWIEHPLNKSLCPCQNRGLPMPAANFTKNEILSLSWGLRCLKYPLIQCLVTGAPANLWSTRSSVVEDNHLWDAALETGAK